ncbi:Alpha/beta hydrolase family protein [Pedobacter westerhofensis]|uniref:Alpha/beta hydrolase family protein n=1 Tax=Pedobacter westerhofensis TaxID=425512 RepID=A0A521BCJ9_9SPHI|nr:alpha/beta fold hydrolase [Pedobacter westerhofensis]SMO44769.1 Alpha/beta hydrolase family protein [Pedobacter westerhofensis]
MNKLNQSIIKRTEATLQPVISLSPIVLPVSGRRHDLELRISAPLTGVDLPIILFAHGFGSSMDGYAPLVNFWAARGFVVIQPTFLDSRTLADHHEADHSEAVKKFLSDPRTALIWRQRVDDMKHILDQLEYIEDLVPGLKGRLDRGRIAAAGHSFGAHTVGLLSGARVIKPNGSLDDVMLDKRIKAAVLLSAGGRGGDALSAFAKEHFPYLEQSYAELRVPTLVVAGDQDYSPLTVLGPEWFTDVFTLSPGAEWLLTLFGAEHMLGGISGYLVRETTDENPAVVAAVQKMTYAYLRSALFPEEGDWEQAIRELEEDTDAVGRIDGKHT